MCERPGKRFGYTARRTVAEIRLTQSKRHQTTEGAGNGGSKPVHDEFTILYNHGTEDYPLERTLAADGEACHYSLVK